MPRRSSGPGTGSQFSDAAVSITMEGLPEMRRALTFVSDKLVPTVAVRALSGLAFDVMEAERKEVRTGAGFKFSSGTTKNFLSGRGSSRVSKARPDRLAAVMYFRNRSRGILEDHAGRHGGRISGVERGHLRFRGKLAIPVAVKGAGTARNAGGAAGFRRVGKRNKKGRVASEDIPWAHNKGKVGGSSNEPFKKRGIGARAFTVKSGDAELIFARQVIKKRVGKKDRSRGAAKGATTGHGRRRSKRARLLFVLVKSAAVSETFDFSRVAHATVQRRSAKKWQAEFKRGLRDARSHLNSITKSTASVAKTAGGLVG